MRFGEPFWLILLVLIPLPWVLARARPAMAWPTLVGFGSKWRLARFYAQIPSLLRALVIACIVLGLARPQSAGGTTRIAAQGVAIIVAIDQSSSMNTPDYLDVPGEAPISRLEAARRTLVRFVAGRPDDLLGLVVFANYPDLACPLTLDHAFVNETVGSIRPARAGDDGTNLGDAMIWAIDALKDAKPRKKVLILLTDGRNSPAVTRPMDPKEAARIAHALGITVHSIAVGKGGGVVQATEPRTKLAIPAEVEGPDLELLEHVAMVGGGHAFVASDAGSLQQVFSTIDSLEKSPVRGEIRTRYREHYSYWIALAVGFVLLDRILFAGSLRRLP